LGHPDAFEPRGGRNSRGRLLVKKKVNPTRIPIEKKESIRWLENLKQSTQLLDHPGRGIHIGDRQMTFTSSSAQHRRSEPIS